MAGGVSNWLVDHKRGAVTTGFTVAMLVAVVASVALAILLNNQSFLSASPFVRGMSYAAVGVGYALAFTLTIRSIVLLVKRAVEEAPPTTDVPRPEPVPRAATPPPPPQAPQPRYAFNDQEFNSESEFTLFLYNRAKRKQWSEKTLDADFVRQLGTLEQFGNEWSASSDLKSIILPYMRGSELSIQKIENFIGELTPSGTRENPFKPYPQAYADALQSAIKAGNIPVVEALLNKKVPFLNDEGPLYWLCEARELTAAEAERLIDLILAQESHWEGICWERADGKTPMHRAIERKNPTVLQALLLKTPWAYYAQNSAGQIPLELAQTLNFEEAVKLLSMPPKAEPPKPKAPLPAAQQPSKLPTADEQKLQQLISEYKLNENRENILQIKGQSSDTLAQLIKKLYPYSTVQEGHKLLIDLRAKAEHSNVDVRGATFSPLFQPVLDYAIALRWERSSYTDLNALVVKLNLQWDERLALLRGASEEEFCQLIGKFFTPEKGFDALETLFDATLENGNVPLMKALLNSPHLKATWETAQKNGKHLSLQPLCRGKLSEENAAQLVDLLLHHPLKLKLDLAEKYSVDEYSYTLIHDAIRHKNGAVLKALLPIMPWAVHTRDLWKNTPLDLATQSCFAQGVDLLCAMGARINNAYLPTSLPVKTFASDKESKTSIATMKPMKGNPEEIKATWQALLKHDPTLLDAPNLLHNLVKQNRIGELQYYIDLGASKKSFDDRQRPPYAYISMAMSGKNEASFEEKRALWETLMAKDAKQALKPNKAKSSEMTRQLVYQGKPVADLEQLKKDNRVNWLCVLAQVRGLSQEQIEVNLKNVSSYNLPKVNGFSPFRLAVQAGNVPFALALLKRGLSETLGLKDDSPFHWLVEAAEISDAEAIELTHGMLENMHVVAWQDKNGNTPLHLAAERKNLPVLRALVTAMPWSVHQQNHTQKSPLDCTVSSGFKEGEELLIQWGASKKNYNYQVAEIADRKLWYLEGVSASKD